MPEPDYTLLLTSARNIAVGSMNAQTRRMCTDYGISWEVAHHALQRSRRLLGAVTRTTLPPIEDTTVFPPGFFDLRLLEQGEIWVDYFRRPHHIGSRREFSDSHLMNTLLFLRAGAHVFRGWHRRVYSPEDWEEELDDTEWLASRILVLSLTLEGAHRSLWPGP